MTILKLVSLFFVCRLAWNWVDLCGSELGLGQTLPFCNECTFEATFWRLVFLLGAIVFAILTINLPTNTTELYRDDNLMGASVRIHWHHILLLLVIITYPLWIWWVDLNTTIPGPDAVWILRNACLYAGFKGTIFWGIVMTFFTIGLRILKRS